jgi:hypothetical protein
MYRTIILPISGPTKPAAIDKEKALIITDKSVKVTITADDSFTHKVKAYEHDGTKYGDTAVKEVTLTKVASRKRAAAQFTGELADLKSNKKYKIELTSEGVVGGQTLVSPPVSVEFETCKFFEKFPLSSNQFSIHFSIINFNN